MRDSDLVDMAAEMPPLIVRREPRYEQQTMPSLVKDEPRKVAVWNLDGVEWSEHAPPRRLHRHWAQTVRGTGLFIFDEVTRCPCGATGGGGLWTAQSTPRVTGPRFLPSALPGADGAAVALTLIILNALGLVAVGSMLLVWWVGADSAPILGALLGIVVGLGAYAYAMEVTGGWRGELAALAVLLVVLTAGFVALLPIMEATGQPHSVACPPGTAVINLSATPGESTCLDSNGRVISTQ